MRMVYETIQSVSAYYLACLRQLQLGSYSSSYGTLINDARVVQPLRQCLNGALSGNRKTKRVASEISIALNEQEVNSFNQVNALLQKSAQLANPRDDATFCLFVDASDEGRASILTQVAVWKPGVASVIEMEGSYHVKITSCCLVALTFSVTIPTSYMYSPLDARQRNTLWVSYCVRSVKWMVFRYTIVHIDGTHNFWEI
ncbi:hypothetical protein PHMEG_00019226 [Phytophthora megakarya]|uniref:Reverse transcriptase/retrotransposon-derived protein RNase H-like domain-containing protein n=1 Tax=Phytophthora megakarya TaxID=4795 RepID=A0A225VTX5_9STRA|nr:hypothetical protein PHMEG_00019226 [Phytophthora megakarya]